MPRVMRRTPATEEAASYGLRDLMREIVGRTVGETREGFRRDPTRLSGEEMIELALGGIGGGIAKLTKAPKAARSLMKLFQREGLKYDAFTEPLPGYGYHQWTLYGEGPAKGATFGTKTTDLAEMEGKIAELMRKFRKEPIKESLFTKVHFDEKGNIVILPRGSGVPTRAKGLIEDIDPYKLYEKQFFAVAEKRPKGRFEITEINVAKALRRKGIGSELYRKLAASVEERGGKLFLERTTEGQTRPGKLLIENLYQKGIISKETGRIR